MKTFIIRIKSGVNEKTYTMRVKNDNKYNAMVSANIIFTSKHRDKFPADFIN
jgi:hypothetical protein